MDYLPGHKALRIFLELAQAILIAEVDLHALVLAKWIARWILQDAATGGESFPFKFFPFVHTPSIIRSMTDWKDRFELEFERAIEARSRGNEGQARVCARRAAGIAIREYYAHRGQSVRTPSAYDLLQLLAEEPHLSPELKQAATYLTLRVTEEFKLPVDVDLLDEARKLCDGLLAESK
jgi:hypothetical protein